MSKISFYRALTSLINTYIFITTLLLANMLNFLLCTEKDRKEAAALERRRQAEEERKKRIFNPRIRLIGNDYEILQKQIEERKQRSEEEKRIELAFEVESLKNDQIALALAQKEREEKKKLEQEINDFRLNYQRKEDRREFDLNDPNYIKKSLPGRLRDDDPRCGISSAQKFQGEDLMNEDRRKMQKEQTKAWLCQQIQERQAAERERKEAEEAYKAAIIARDSRAIELDQMEKECRKRLELACARYNQALKNERESSEKETQRQEREDNLAEIYNMMTSDIMTENPDVSKSNLGANRQVGYLYKGMTPEQKMAVRQEQLSQIAEAKKRKEEQERAQKEFEEYLNGLQKTVYLMDRELDKKKKEELKALAEDNKRMGEEHKNYKEYLNKVVYSNKPTAAYFDQFNRSTR